MFSSTFFDYIQNNLSETTKSLKKIERHNIISRYTEDLRVVIPTEIELSDYLMNPSNCDMIIVRIMRVNYHGNEKVLYFTINNQMFEFDNKEINTLIHPIPLILPKGKIYINHVKSKTPISEIKVHLQLSGIILN